MEQRNQLIPEKIDPDILLCGDAERLSHVLRLFVMEARKVDSDRYPPGTTRNLLHGISCELIKNKALFAILDKSDLRLRELHLTLDPVSSELHHTSVGVKLISSWYKLTRCLNQL